MGDVDVLDLFTEHRRQKKWSDSEGSIALKTPSIFNMSEKNLNLCERAFILLSLTPSLDW